MLRLKPHASGAKPECFYETSTGAAILVRVADPARVHRFIDRLYFVIGGLTLSSCWLPFVIRNHPNPLSSLLFLFALGCALIVRARMFPRPKLKAVLADRRPPVLYLRSFRDDESMLHATVRESRCLGEADLVAALATTGPVYAVGRPSEPLPPEGAIRVYVDDRHWQSLVKDAIPRCRAVVLRVGTSDGLGWEIAQVAEQLKPTRLMLYFPQAGESTAGHDERFSQFRRRILAHVAATIPESLDRSTLLYLDSQWRAYRIHPEQSEFLDWGARKERNANSQHPAGLTIILCPFCGTRVCPMAAGNCPACQADLAPQASELDVPKHPLAEELRSLARDSHFFPAPAKHTWLTRRMPAWLNHNVTLPTWLKGRTAGRDWVPAWLRRSMRLLERATFGVRSTISNGMAIMLICGLIATAIHTHPPLPRKSTGGRLARIARLWPKPVQQPPNTADRSEAVAHEMLNQQLAVEDMMQRARKLAAKGKVEEAVRRMEAAIELNSHASAFWRPTNESIYLEVARLQKQLRRYNDAEKNLRTAMSSPFLASAASLELASLWEQTGKVDDARKLYLEVIESSDILHRPNVKDAARAALQRLADAAANAKVSSPRLPEDTSEQTFNR